MGYGILEFSDSEILYGISIIIDEKLHLKASSGIINSLNDIELVLIAIDSQADPVGCLTWSPCSDFTTLNIYVKEDFRKKGIGTLLLNYFKTTPKYNPEFICVDRTGSKSNFWSKTL